MHLVLSIHYTGSTEYTGNQCKKIGVEIVTGNATVRDVIIKCTDHGLQVDLGVPVRVVDDDHICCGQVNAQASSPGAQHEYELGAVGLVEGID